MMVKTLDGTQTLSRSGVEQADVVRQNMQMTLLRAQPRLLHLARKYVPLDSVDDVVQETMIEAWQHLEQLRDPERLDAWLNGICVNVCLRWKTADYRHGRHMAALSEGLQSVDDMQGAFRPLYVDNAQFDPAEVLSRRDLMMLLDQALGHLSPLARTGLLLYYLEEKSQNEIAHELGVTTNALKVQLHRARRQLRRVLQQDLRSEARACGLFLQDDNLDEWRDSRLWCCICGRHQLSGRFERSADGTVNMCLRCPACSPICGDIVNTFNLVSVGGLQSFRPAFKRALKGIGEFLTHVSHTRSFTCPLCKGMARWDGLTRQSMPAPVHARIGIVLHCDQCGDLTTSVSSLCMGYPAIQQFLAEHPRSLLLPETFLERNGEPAIQVQLADYVSSRKLILLLDQATLHVREVFCE